MLPAAVPDAELPVLALRRPKLQKARDWLFSFSLESTIVVTRKETEPIQVPMTNDVDYSQEYSAIQELPSTIVLRFLARAARGSRAKIQDRGWPSQIHGP